MTQEELRTLKQPRALSILFFTEMWERYGFYTVQALLVLYLTGSMHFTDTQAYTLFGGFSALLYGTTVIGGYLADHFIGFRRSIMIGVILYVVGYFLMAIPTHLTFYISLSLLIIATGYFKANVSSFLGTFYGEDDPRRDSGFTLFYMGINLGAMIGPVVSGYIATHFGFHYAFIVASLGLLAGALIFYWGKRHFQNNGLLAVGRQEKNLPELTNRQHTYIYLGTLIAIPVFILLVEHAALVNVLLTIFSILAVLYVLYHIFKLHHEQRHKLLALLALMIFAVIFWGLFMQLFLSVTLFIERNVDRAIFHTSIPTAAFISLEGFFIIILSPIFAHFWRRYAHTRWMPSTTNKFVLGLLSVAICFIILRFSSALASSTFLAPAFMIVLAYLAITIAELFLSPIGLSAVTELSPPNLVGAMMGIWFLTISLGLALAGKLAAIAAVPSSVTTPAATLVIYKHAFMSFAYLAFGAALILFLLSPMLKRLMHEHK